MPRGCTPAREGWHFHYMRERTLVHLHLFMCSPACKRLTFKSTSWPIHYVTNPRTYCTVGTVGTDYRGNYTHITTHHFSVLKLVCCKTTKWNRFNHSGPNASTVAFMYLILKKWWEDHLKIRNQWYGDWLSRSVRMIKRLSRIQFATLRVFQQW